MNRLRIRGRWPVASSCSTTSMRAPRFQPTVGAGRRKRMPTYTTRRAGRRIIRVATGPTTSRAGTMRRRPTRIRRTPTSGIAWRAPAYHSATMASGPSLGRSHPESPQSPRRRISRPARIQTIRATTSPGLTHRRARWRSPLGSPSGSESLRPIKRIPAHSRRSSWCGCRMTTPRGPFRELPFPGPMSPITTTRLAYWSTPCHTPSSGRTPHGGTGDQPLHPTGKGGLKLLQHGCHATDDGADRWHRTADPVRRRGDPHAERLYRAAKPDAVHRAGSEPADEPGQRSERPPGGVDERNHHDERGPDAGSNPQRGDLEERLWPGQRHADVERPPRRRADARLTSLNAEAGRSSRPASRESLLPSVVRQEPRRPGGGVLNLDAALPEDRAQTIRVFEALLTPRLATQREEDIDKRRHVLADIVAPAAAYEVAEADDQVAHLGPRPVALIGANHIRRPLVEHALGLEDGRHDAVDVASIEGVTALKGPLPRLLEHWRGVPVPLQCGRGRNRRA